MTWQDDLRKRFDKMQQHFGDMFSGNGLPDILQPPTSFVSPTSGIWAPGWVYKQRFLWFDAAWHGMNIGDPSMPAVTQNKIIHDFRRGDNIAAVFLANAGDSQFGNTSIYSGNRHGQNISTSKLRALERVLIEQKSVTGFIDGWLHADDSRSITSISEVVTDKWLVDAVRNLDAVVDMWTLGLELDKYWTRKRVLHHCQVLRGLTNKAIFIHCTRWDKAISWYFGGTNEIVLPIDGIHGQYAFHMPPSRIGNETSSAIARLQGTGLKYVAFEYGGDNDTQADKDRGKEALHKGADGTGNGV